MKKRIVKIMRLKQKGFTLVEVMIAAGILLIVIVSILGLAQIEVNSLISLWGSSYSDTALLKAKQIIEGLRCDKILLLKDEMIIDIGKEKIILQIDKFYEERLNGRVMWFINIKVKGNIRNNVMEVKKYCP